MKPNGMSKEMLESLENLTEKERKYFAMMWAKYGVLFISSKPGVAKSAIGRSIAEKMGFAYLDMRLSMSDESDFKYPPIFDSKTQFFIKDLKEFNFQLKEKHCLENDSNAQKRKYCKKAHLLSSSEMKFLTFYSK